MDWRKSNYKDNPIYKLLRKQVGVDLYKAELKSEEETRKIIKNMMESSQG